MGLKTVKRIVLVVVGLACAFLLTRPGDYRALIADFDDRLHDQWCAWSEPLGHRCDRWRKVRAVVEDAKELGQSIREQLPELSPPGKATPRQP